MPGVCSRGSRPSSRSRKPMISSFVGDGPGEERPAGPRGSGSGRRIDRRNGEGPVASKGDRADVVQPATSSELSAVVAKFEGSDRADVLRLQALGALLHVEL